MQFQLIINMVRLSPATDMRDVVKHTLEMVQMADEGGFAIAWVPEHHAIEMTISPGPFQLLTHWANHTNRIRLGTAVIVAPYWHPIKLAGEAALFDVISNGRLEFGIGRGAYQREFDRLANGMDQNLGVPYMQEMLPVLKKLWAGDYEHKGEYWSFPTATSVPKPIQKPHPPIWVAARDPGTYDWAIKNGCNIMSWPLSRPFSEAESYKERFENALKANPGIARPIFMMMRSVIIDERPDGIENSIKAVIKLSAQFENLFKNLGGVANGFVEEVDITKLGNRDEYNPAMLLENLIIGSPESAIAKLKRYEALGVDHFGYQANAALSYADQKRSLKLFIDEVMPAFAESKVPMRGAAE
ncbi:MAG: LLM class flavin-dependent oxidoreductase [Dongiaceae bacterium]